MAFFNTLKQVYIPDCAHQTLRQRLRILTSSALGRSLECFGKLHSRSLRNQPQTFDPGYQSTTALLRKTVVSPALLCGSGGFRAKGRSCDWKISSQDKGQGLDFQFIKFMHLSSNARVGNLAEPNCDTELPQLGRLTIRSYGESLPAVPHSPGKCCLLLTEQACPST